LAVSDESSPISARLFAVLVVALVVGLAVLAALVRWVILL